MKKLFILLAVTAILVYPIMAAAQTKGKTQEQQPPGQTQQKAQGHEQHHPKAQGQAQPETKTQMMCPGMMMMQGQMPPEMQKQMQEHMGQMMKGHLEPLQKQIDELRQRVETIESQKKK